MRRLILLFVVAGVIVGLVAVSHLSLRAQSESKPAAERAKAVAGGVTELAKLVQSDSVQDALLKPYPFRFARPTPLADVAQQLSRELGLPVVLDLAALGRLDVKPEDTVKLELRGVRLKTGLKLLLDQVGLTYKVVAEDNLLILTDKQGSEDPIERVMAEIHELHRDIHDIQDALDEVRELTGLSGAEGARVRKPTIIEEMPENQDAKPHEGATSKPSTRPEPSSKPQGLPSARPRTSL
ncbi:MAG: hypothetical protein ACLQU5_10530 [Isosphaeraceae bacterium]